MDKTSNLRHLAGPLLAVAVIVLVLVGYLIYRNGQQAGIETGRAVSVAPDKTSDATSLPMSESTADGSTETAAVEPSVEGEGDTENSGEADTAPIAQLHAPSFDVVRVPPNGLATVAGRADPGVSVSILIDGVPALEVTTDDRGDFVALFDLAASDTPRELVLSARRQDDTVFSDETVIISPASSEDVSNAATTAESVAGVSETEAPEAKETATAPQVLVADEEGVRVISRPQGGADLTIDAISYGASGEVFASGRGPTDTPLRLYLDNDLAVEATVATDGQWRVSLDEIAAGLYTMRVDAVDPTGRVLSRAETPFMREESRDIAAIAPEKTAVEPEDQATAVQADTVEVPDRVSTITVQPGNTLWAIASEKYGDGPLFVRVFEANADQIRNPDLIYPGQVFVLPE